MEPGQLFGSVGHDVPPQHLLIDEAGENPTREAREIRILLDQTLGVETDGFIEILLGHFREDGSTQFELDLVVAEIQIQSPSSKSNPSAQVRPIPKIGRAIGATDQNHRLLSRVIEQPARGGLLFLLGPLRATKLTEQDVAFRSLVVALAHQLLLNPILDVLDVDELRLAFPDLPSHRIRDIAGGSGIHVNRQK